MAIEAQTALYSPQTDLWNKPGFSSSSVNVYERTRAEKKKTNPKKPKPKQRNAEILGMFQSATKLTGVPKALAKFSSKRSKENVTYDSGKERKRAPARQMAQYAAGVISAVSVEQQDKH